MRLRILPSCLQRLLMVLGGVLCFVTAPAWSRDVSVAEGSGGAASTGHPEATAEALRVLQAGGNAVDAAVAAGFVLGVVDFSNSGLGGDGFALIRQPSGRLIALAAAAPPPARTGVASSPHGFPAEAALLLTMQRDFGRLPLSQVIHRAVHLAESGFPASDYLAGVIERTFPDMVDGRARAFLAPGGRRLRAGEIISQPLLAATLRTISEDAGTSFYRGRDAGILVEHLAGLGTPFTREDLADYEVQRRPPLELQIGSWRLIGCPPPCSSVVSMGIIEFLLKIQPAEDPQLPQEALTAFLFDALQLKYNYLSDCLRNPRKFLHLVRHPRFRGDGIRARGAETDDSNRSNTTHLIIWDKDDAIVSMTLTLGSHFGSRVLSPLGFFYNNEMRNFTSKVSWYGPDYSFNHGPISAKAPLLVLNGEKPVLALGGAGANRIVTNVAIIAATVLQGRRSLAEAVARPRFFVTHTRKLRWENHPLAAGWETTVPVSQRGRALPYGSDYFGLVTAIEKEGNVLRAIGDFRRDGMAGALSGLVEGSPPPAFPSSGQQKQPRETQQP